MPTWYLGIWGVVLILAVMTRSLVAQIAMLFVWGLGVYYVTGLQTVEVVRLGIVGLFVLGMGYQAIEMVVKVDRF